MPISKTQGYAGRTFVKTSSAAEALVNYSRAVRHGDWVFVANTSGTHWDEHRIDDDIEGQTHQMIRNVAEVLASVGAKPQDIVKAVVHCPNPDEYPKALEILKSFFSNIRPAAAFLCTPLASANLKIEMEVTALVTETKS